MKFNFASTAEPFNESDEFIRNALEHASIPTLMMSMVHMSGDTSILNGKIHPEVPVLGELQGYMSEEDKAAVRQQAFEIVKSYRDRGCTLPAPPNGELIQRMMSFMVNETIPQEYVPMMLEEMELGEENLRGSNWQFDKNKSTTDMRVLIIGGGMSGLLAAIRLKEVGIPFLLVEKNPEPGGTWYENSYPGCRVDIANHFYCYSFEPNHDWPEYFSTRDELMKYFKHCAEKYELLPDIRFATEVVAATFDNDKLNWQVELSCDNQKQNLEFNAIISAVGQLNRAKFPTIEGRESFAGESFHSSAWPQNFDLQGKKVAVIGSGASAFQLVPEVAKGAQELVVFQRSPPWMFPNPAYHDKVSSEKKWLFHHIPYYARWFRFLLFWPGSDGLLPSLVIDKEWPHQDRSINQMNDDMRAIFSDFITSQVADRPDLLPKVLPTYPPFCKRMLQDNGLWLGTMKKPNVVLETNGIDKITPTGITSVTGEHYDLDVIVYATGFHGDKFLWPMAITGSRGQSLEELWDDDPQAYLGITVPDFPNLFCLFGPGTNLAHAGSIIFHSECQMRYVIGCLKMLYEGGHHVMDCKDEVNQDYNMRMQKRLEEMVWSLSATGSWYQNSKGKVVTTSPWRLVDYWNWTRQPQAEDYQFR